MRLAVVFLFCIGITLFIFVTSTKILGTSFRIQTAASEQVLLDGVSLQGNKRLSEHVQIIHPNILKNKDTLQMRYNLNGLCILGGKASSLSLEQLSGSSRKIVSLSEYGKNCFDGEQTVNIPLADFKGGNRLRNVQVLRLSLWYPTSYKVDVKSISLVQSKTFARQEVVREIPTLIPTPMPTQTVTQPPEQPTDTRWAIRSVSSMKETKDKVCNQNSEEFIKQWVTKAKDLGSNYVSIETPYDNPSCGDSLAYTKTWVAAVRLQGMNVWHRHMPLAFEGIYDTPKDPSINYLTFIERYIQNNPDIFKEGDIFTPVPEPQNGGIAGVTYCPQAVCIFQDRKEFNTWLREAIDVSNRTFEKIGLKDKIKTGYFGFDGFVAWGDNNPDWKGILEEETVIRMGNITIDHYPEIVDDTMENDLNELQKKYPDAQIVIGEWGTISDGDTTTQIDRSMKAAQRKNVVGFNYWHMGMGGNESLLNEDFSEKPAFKKVQSFFKK